MKKLITFIIFLFLIILSIENHAQKFTSEKRYWSAGISLGGANYVGDLDPGQSMISPAINFTRPHIGIHANYKFSPVFSWISSVSFNRIKGDDANTETIGENFFRNYRNLNVRNDIIEINTGIQLNFFENRGRWYQRPHYTPFIFASIAYFHHNPKGNIGEGWEPLKPLETENVSYSLHQVAFPFGIGFKYQISKKLDLQFKIGWRLTFTDYLDDVSSDYTHPSELKSKKAARYANPSTIGVSDEKIEQIEQTHQIIYYDLEKKTEYKTKAEAEASGNEYLKSVAGYGKAPYQRGDNENNSNRDWYIITTFQLNYIFPGDVEAPSFRR